MMRWLLSLPMWLGYAAASPAAPSDFPEVHFRDPPHSYWSRKPADAFARRTEATQNALAPALGGSPAALQTLLETLGIPVTSQLWVYSATSLQSGLIRPANPRALYFNHELYVGFVPDGRLEVAAIDPEMGPVFYLVESRGAAPVQVSRSTRCMNCHASQTTERVPGLFAESVLVNTTGASLDGFRRGLVGHTLPIPERLGGWHVTGAPPSAKHLGNLLAESRPGGYASFPNPPGAHFAPHRYPVQSSDFLAHLIHEHQIGFHNLVTLAVYHARENRENRQDVLQKIALRLVRYVLFQNEAPLPPGGITPDPAFVRDFLRGAHRTPEGASLRELDLKTRLFSKRCSYMIHTPSFAALPEDFLQPFREALEKALRIQNAPAEFDYLPADEKKAIRSILRQTRILP
ncbi:MAG: hypothetical protein RLZZ399_473 [Verrucomicrobiota bacterium]|jgi:hypothetical protein